jgi:hypothetical protein
MKSHPLLFCLLLTCCTLPFTFASADLLSDPGAAERGRYLMIAGGCNDCHTPGYMQTDGQVPLETMLLIRAYEEQLVELQRSGAPGTCTSVGQEACAVGVSMRWSRATAS